MLNELRINALEAFNSISVVKTLRPIQKWTFITKNLTNIDYSKKTRLPKL